VATLAHYFDVMNQIRVGDSMAGSLLLGDSGAYNHSRQNKVSVMTLLNKDLKRLFEGVIDGCLNGLNVKDWIQSVVNVARNIVSNVRDSPRNSDSVFITENNRRLADEPEKQTNSVPYLFGAKDDPLPGGIHELLEAHQFRYDSDNVQHCLRNLKVCLNESLTLLGWTEKDLRFQSHGVCIVMDNLNTACQGHEGPVKVKEPSPHGTFSHLRTNGSKPQNNTPSFSRRPG
jgi:hypothetical protein